MAIQVRWVHPVGVTTDFNKTRIERAMNIQGPYNPLTEIATFDATTGAPNLSFLDSKGSREQFYTLRFFNDTTKLEFDDYTLGLFQATPREKLLITYVAGWVPDILKPDLTDFDVQFALALALKDFNIYPPETFFGIGDFPPNYENFLITGTKINILYQKYLKIAIRDFSYADMGLSLNHDRGSKMKEAEHNLKAAYDLTIDKAKWNFISQGVSVGTVPLPLSIGTSFNRGLLNVLDIFNAFGR